LLPFSEKPVYNKMLHKPFHSGSQMSYTEEYLKDCKVCAGSLRDKPFSPKNELIAS